MFGLIDHTFRLMTSLSFLGMSFNPSWAQYPIETEGQSTKPSNAKRMGRSRTIYKCYAKARTALIWVAGENSLDTNASIEETTDVTLSVGSRLQNESKVWIKPETDQSFGLSNTVGAAGLWLQHCENSLPQKE